MNAMQPPQSVEEVKATLETTEKGGVRQSIRNCLTVFQRDPVLAGAIAYNILTDRKDIIKPIGFHRESTALTDTDMKYLLLYLEETYGLTSEKKIETAIGIVANENKYHPIRDFLNSLAWDGTERIRFCLRHFLGADVDDYTYEALKLFMLGAITRAFKPGSKFEIMLCLVGGQGAGKSTFFRLLAVRDEWFSDDLRKLDDDNVYRKLQGHWIIEMSEMMATANAKSIEEIKSFLSRQKEVYKIPYETHPADRPRQCVFGGTSNALDFLPLTVPATADLSRSWCTRSKPRFTFWRTKPLPEPISARCGRKQWRFTEAACSSYHSAQPCSGISKNTSGILCRRTPKPG